MRAFCVVLALASLVSACGGDPTPAAPAASAAVVDRTPGERPAGTIAELALDGGDAALGALIAPLPPGTLRAALPSRLTTLLDGMIETPTEIRSRVSGSSPLRLVLARVDGETHAAVVVRLDEPLPASLRHGDGPRGSDRVGPSAAVDDRIAVVSDDPELLAQSFAYLAYTSLPRAGTDGAIVVSAPATAVATTVRAGLEQMVRDQRSGLLASIAMARAAHDRPPDVGDPEAVVTAVADALLARLAYLPDLGDATLTLQPSASGLALAIEAAVTPRSPLASALAAHTPVSPSLLSAMPTSSALVIATGTSAEARAAEAGDLSALLGGVGGARVSAGERAGLDEASARIAQLRGDEGALAIGATDVGAPFALTLTRGGTDAAAPAPWGRAFPWTSALLGALSGCTPTAPRSSPTGTPLCGDVALATVSRDGARADAIGPGAAALAEAARAALAQAAPPSSPDLARDLGALPTSPFALALARPLRMLPLVVGLGGPPRAGLPRGDGAAVLALAHDAGRLQIVLRASTSAMADLDAVVRLFADETDSE